MNHGEAPFKPRNSIAGFSVKKTKKTQRYLELAKNTARQSKYGKIRHGAVLVKGGSIINISHNKSNFSAFGNRFRKYDCGHATHHAELGCILGLDRSKTSGSVIYVVRINKDDEEFAISNLFRFANAGITDALESGDKNVIVKFDDSADNLAGKQINVYYYKDAKGYTACLNQVAPTSFKNIADDFSEDDVAYYKNKAENYYQKYILPKIKQKTEHTTVEEVADVPF